MKTNKVTVLVMIIGVLVLCVFTDIAILSIFPRDDKNNLYYFKIEDKMGAQIEAMDIDDDRLKITASGNAIQYCVKSTKSTPSSNAICWKSFNNNEATISIYHYKKYYVWIKDINGNISSPMSINTKNN